MSSTVEAHMLLLKTTVNRQGSYMIGTLSYLSKKIVYTWERLSSKCVIRQSEDMARSGMSAHYKLQL